MTKATDKPIARSDLTRSYTACYRVEDHIMTQLRATGLHIDSPAVRVLPALHALTEKRPAWCEDEAWVCMCAVFARWCSTYGTLARFQELRRTKEKAAPVAVVMDSEA